MSRYYRDPLTEHMVTHKHDLRDGSMGEPAGGETAEQRERDTPKKPAEEAMRPSHVLGAEKDAPAPEDASAKGLAELEAAGSGEGRMQEGLRRSGKASAGVGGPVGR